ncbi:MAG: rod shape-determining protein MreD [Peptostreptococcaceae bacterium]|nr:rod shape-determining protein MreD [Peptostreptococcaceae bacterium]
MKNLIYFLIGFLAILLFGTIFNFIETPLPLNRIDFLFIYVTFLSVFIGSERASILGMLLGFIEDVFWGRYLGFHALLLLCAGLCFGSFKDKIFKERFGASVLLLMTGLSVKGLLSVFLYRTEADSMTDLWLRVAIILLVNLFVGILLYYPLKKLIRRIEQ